MFIKTLTKYDGSILHQRFAYRFFRDKCSATGNIIAFRGEMEVLAGNMLDQEDVLNQAFIFSEDAINFIWEIPLLGNNAFGAVAYQRLFNSLIAEKLSKANYLNKPVIMRGDDIYVCDENRSDALGKCSVSITHVQDGAALGHIGINIKAGKKAPPHAYSIYLSDEQVNAFIEEVIDIFYSTNHDMFIATTKIIK